MSFVKKTKKDTSSDFAAYYALLNGIDKSWVAPHNIRFRQAKTHAQVFKKITKKYKLNCSTILDVGCGAGFITNELTMLLPQSKICGIDIATDAIEYAKINFKKADFWVEPISNKTKLGKTFNIIHAREFYPFTRTNKTKIHLEYLKTLADHLDDNGAIMIYLLPLEKSLLTNLENISPHLEEIGLKHKYSKILIPVSTAYHFFPSLGISQYLSRLLNFIRKRKNYCCLVFYKK